MKSGSNGRLFLISALFATFLVVTTGAALQSAKALPPRGCLPMTGLKRAGSIDIPSAPSNCMAIANSLWGQPYAYVTWTDNSNNEDGFEVQWYVGGVLEGATIVGPDVTSAAMGRRSKSTNKYRVRAFNSAGNSNWSNWASVSRDH